MSGYNEQLTKFVPKLYEEIVNYTVNESVKLNFIDRIQRMIASYRSGAQFQIADSETLNFFSKFFGYSYDEKMVKKSKVYFLNL